MTNENKTEKQSGNFIENKTVAWQTAEAGVRRKVMAYGDQVMLVRVEFENGAVGSLHSHPHVQVSNVESGVFEIEIDKDKKILQAGDAFYVPPHIMHGAVCIEAGVLVDVFSPMREDFLEVL